MGQLLDMNGSDAQRTTVCSTTHPNLIANFSTGNCTCHDCRQLICGETSCNQTRVVGPCRPHSYVQPKDSAKPEILTLRGRPEDTKKLPSDALERRTGEATRRTFRPLFVALLGKTIRARRREHRVHPCP